MGIIKRGNDYPSIIVGENLLRFGRILKTLAGGTFSPLTGNIYMSHLCHWTCCTFEGHINWETNGMNISRNKCGTSDVFKAQRDAGNYGPFEPCRHEPKCIVSKPMTIDHVLNKNDWGLLRSTFIHQSLFGPLLARLHARS